LPAYSKPIDQYAQTKTKIFYMTQHTALLLTACLLSTIAFSQGDTANLNTAPHIFARLSREVAGFQPDTTAAPDDKLTRKIRELRSLGGGFNINEAIDFKLEEDRQKKEVPREELDGLTHFFKSGDGKRWVDNATVWIYRRHFSYREVKQLVKFYKTTAGQKMAADFPVIMLQSLKAAEMIKEGYNPKALK
jgi:hypothetical protein